MHLKNVYTHITYIYVCHNVCLNPHALPLCSHHCRDKKFEMKMHVTFYDALDNHISDFIISFFMFVFFKSLETFRTCTLKNKK